MRPLVNAIVADAGGVCWLCEVGVDANSADHEPPRSQLVAAGVPNPDDPAYLHASHLICNKRRGTRPVTPGLKAELRRRRLDDIARADATAAPSPRFARRSFESRPRHGKHLLPDLSPRTPAKNESERP